MPSKETDVSKIIFWIQNTNLIIATNFTVFNLRHVAISLAAVSETSLIIFGITWLKLFALVRRKVIEELISSHS